MLLIDVVCRRMVSPDVVVTMSESAMLGLLFPHMFLQKRTQWHARDSTSLGRRYDIDIFVRACWNVDGVES